MEEQPGKARQHQRRRRRRRQQQSTVCSDVTSQSSKGTADPLDDAAHDDVAVMAGRTQGDLVSCVERDAQSESAKSWASELSVRSEPESSHISLQETKRRRAVRSACLRLVADLRQIAREGPDNSIIKFSAHPTSAEVMGSHRRWKAELSVAVGLNSLIVPGCRADEKPPTSGLLGKDKAPRTTKEAAWNRRSLVEAGTVELLVDLLGSPCPEVQQGAASVLANLAADSKAKRAFAVVSHSRQNNGGAPAAGLVRMLRPDLAARIPGHFHLPAEGIRPGYSAVGEAVDVAAAALRSLGVLAANRKAIRQANAIQPLVSLLASPQLFAQRAETVEAVVACLWQLAFDELGEQNIVAIGAAGAVRPLLRLVGGKETPATENAETMQMAAELLQLLGIDDCEKARADLQHQETERTRQKSHDMWTLENEANRKWEKEKQRQQDLARERKKMEAAEKAAEARAATNEKLRRQQLADEQAAINARKKALEEYLATNPEGEAVEAAVREKEQLAAAEAAARGSNLGWRAAVNRTMHGIEMTQILDDEKDAREQRERKRAEEIAAAIRMEQRTKPMEAWGADAAYEYLVNQVGLPEVAEQIQEMANVKMCVISSLSRFTPCTRTSRQDGIHDCDCLRNACIVWADLGRKIM